ncbi:polysaccharide pyruvyl transferase family protein [Sphingomonas sp. LB-2]|uniref:polysaccharide pyruvyl transferase family protein n=1 Tax=Sphingomonas caeni TaxID=2984949 RepID=UPI002232655F|nr:polysaccharide pyruvyl transferase family protein [Sphingomonas caeni]MCW3846630.1 polysaccharide pyruvyl transferase family protein [Sphingomonas caeni]
MADSCFAMLCYPLSHNLGDEIQSIAARTWLPRVDRLVSREALDRDPGAEVAMILNGWFMHRPRHWPPHPRFAPLVTSLHLSRDRPGGPRAFWNRTAAERMLRGEGRAWLERHGPVGARDPSTLDLLQRAGIDAYHSGCLTLTLPRPEVARGDAVIACDLGPAELAALRTVTSAPVVTTHIDRATRDPHQRLEKAAALLDLYARAKAVVTSRIHCALPCLALGTPVLFVTQWPGHYRLEPAMRLALACSAKDFIAGRHGFDFAAPPPNPDRYLPFREALIARVRASPLLTA